MSYGVIALCASEPFEFLYLLGANVFRKIRGVCVGGQALVQTRK